MQAVCRIDSADSRYDAPMRLGLALLVLALSACGSVPSTPDAARDAAAVIDAPAGDGQACAGNTIEACGPTCRQCEVTSERQVATCDGTECGVACKNDAPACTDNSCSRIVWDFEDMTIGGLMPRAPAGLQLAARNFNGANALAIDVASLQEISFSLPVCLSGTVDVRAKAFSFRVFFQGGNSSGEQYYIQSSVPSPMNGGYLNDQVGVAGNVWTAHTASLAQSQFSNTTSTITIQAGTLGAAFGGTIWFDDFKIE